MRIAALYDIHGNLPALDAVLVEVAAARAELILVGGDVFPGPLSLECLRRLENLPIPVRFVRGNGDREVVEMASGSETLSVPENYRPQMQWVADQLGPEDLSRIAEWPLSVRIDTADLGQILFCHATPRSDAEIFVRTTEEPKLLRLFAEAGAPVVVCGHTHMQFDRRIGNTRVVNAGSVGMPFGDRGAYWLLVDRDIELMRTDYDFEDAAQTLGGSGYPGAPDYAQSSVLEPPSEDDMLHLFSQAELGA